MKRYNLLESQQAVRDRVVEFGKTVIEPVAAEYDRRPEPQIFPRDYYEKAAEAGSPEAQVRLGFLLDHAEDNEKAVHWYRAAADQGYPDGLGGLAEMYAKGEGVPRDPAKARELFEKAGEAGHAPSIRVLIAAYDQGGLDVERDASKLAYWRDKQASLNTSED